MYKAAEIERLAHDFLLTHAGRPFPTPIDIDLMLEQVDGVVLDIWPGLRKLHGIEGAVVRDADTGDLIILVDDWLADHAPTRYRMTVAEELGHVVLHRRVIDHINSNDDFSALQQHEQWHKMERNAKRFGAAALMAAESVSQSALIVYRKLVAAAGYGDKEAIKRHLAALLAKQFVVSVEAMRYRLGEWPMRVFDRVDEAMNARMDSW